MKNPPTSVTNDHTYEQFVNIECFFCHHTDGVCSIEFVYPLGLFVFCCGWCFAHMLPGYGKRGNHA